MRTNDKKRGMIHWWHLIYIIGILLTILFCVIICLSKESVSDAAMDNVSFASAIVSIVLAVVSIVVSLYATFSTSANLGSMQDVAHGIKRSLSKIKSLKDVADDSNRRIQELTSRMLEKATPEEVRQKQDIEQIEAEVAAEAENHNGSVSDDDAPSEDDTNSESSDTAKGTSPNGTIQKQAITRHEISEIEAKAIEKVSDMLGLGDIMRDYKLSVNDMTLMFDAVSESPSGQYTFIEVGITPASPSFVEMRISRFRQYISMMFERMQSAGSHVYYVVVFRDNNKSRFLSRIRLRRRNRSIILSNTPYLTILYFNLNEL
ncbi:hypothetical protein [Muribaculum intestinale]|uniref:hypothetical protein n=1 Tax=Muribaculum intestinale TaxID=1796646 RepID=UPI002494EE5B|nr:hypothetical protein [Muribaculum intestinale]